jgi:hypothetical protein
MHLDHGHSWSEFNSPDVIVKLNNAGMTIAMGIDDWAQVHSPSGLNIITKFV